MENYKYEGVTSMFFYEKEKWSPIPMVEDGNRFTITQKKKYQPLKKISIEALKKSFVFAYEMAKGSKHREYRTGGIHKRSTMEIFENAFLGKASEFVLCEYLGELGLKVKEPDIKVRKRGDWDTADLIVNVGNSVTKKITVKSTKCYGNLLLLECDDWNDNATYKHSKENEGNYDLFILVRVNLKLEPFLKGKRFFDSDISESDIWESIQEDLDASYDFDIPGFLVQEDIQEVIKNKQFISKGDMLNGSTKMDASNYYVQAGNLRSLDTLVDELTS